jgi:hypothetical protein
MSSTDNYKPKNDTEENQANMLESVLLKLEAHKNYIVRRIEDKGKKLQAKVTFDSVIKYIYSAKDVIPPDEIREYVFLISDNKTHQNVLDTYEDIYYNMYKRYYGRSEDSYLERV